MKNIKFLFLLVATLFAGAFTACQEDWAPGQPDSELSVYLPVEVNNASFATKDDKSTERDEMTVALYPVYRQNGGAEMTVDIRSRFVNPDAVVYTVYKYDEEGNVVEDADGYAVVDRYIYPEDAFDIAESVTFAEGETVAYLEVKLNPSLIGEDAEGNKKTALKVGTLFYAEIMVKNAENQGNYGLFRKTIGIGIPETWKKLSETVKEAKLKKGTFTEDFFTFIYSSSGGAVVSVEVEESESRPGYYRLVNVFTQENIITMLGGVPSEVTYNPGTTYIEVDATDPKNVYIPYQPAGFSIQGFIEPVYIASGRAIGKTDAKLVDGIISFDKMTVGILDGSGSGYLTNQNGLMRITLPGVSLEDYSITATFLGTESNADNSQTRANLGFTLGADVTAFRFAVVEGKKPIYTEKLGKRTYDVAIQNVINDEYERTDADNMANAARTETEWYVSLPEAGIYTVFAVPYGADNKPVMDNISRAFFYYRAANMDDAVPEIEDMKLSFDYLSSFGASEDEYPSQYTLGFNMGVADRSDVLDYVSNITRCFMTTAEYDALIAKGETDESLLASDLADDTTSWIPDIKAGSGTMVLQGLVPNTSYTMLFSVTSIYGKTKYYHFEKTTSPYDIESGLVQIGTYEFTEGDSKMSIKFEPSFSISQYRNTGDGQLFYLTWVGDALQPAEEDEEPFELNFYGYRLKEWNAIICYGQAVGFENYGSLFNVDIDTYNNDENKYWGYQSSSFADFGNGDFAAETFVVHYDEESGLINELGTYFRKYVKNVEKKKNEETGKMEEIVTYDYINNFTKEAVITLLAEESNDGAESDNTANGGEIENGGTTEDDKSNEGTESSIGVIREKKDVTFSVMTDLMNLERVRVR